VIATLVLVDSGPLVAIISGRDSRHHQCVQAAMNLPPVLYTCWPVITEAAYLLRRTPDGVQALLSRVENGALRILDMAADDITAVRGILDKYQDQGFDLADVCLMHLSEREKIEHVFTLDRRHFLLFRTRDGASLELSP
jgi:predicted nucleic acid-binding protein